MFGDVSCYSRAVILTTRNAVKERKDLQLLFGTAFPQDAKILDNFRFADHSGITQPTVPKCHKMCTMKMSRLRFSILLLGACAMRSSVSDCQTFAVTIKASVALVERNEPFEISAEVRNVGTREETIEVMQCIYPSDWISDNPVVRVIYSACLQNEVFKKKLKPGEVYKKRLFARIVPSESTQDKNVTFRLGDRIKVSGGDLKPPTVSPPIWSKPVTIVMNR